MYNVILLNQCYFDVMLDLERYLYTFWTVSGVKPWFKILVSAVGGG